MTSNLETLLFQLRDGPLDASVLARARALAADDRRIPADLRDLVLLDPDEASSDAAGLLAVLGADDLGAVLASGIAAESEPITPAMWSELDAEWAPIGAALREGLEAIAASADVADAVLRRVPLADFAWGPVLADAIAREADTADVAPGVHAALGLAHAPVAAAVYAEAGTVDVVDQVSIALGLAQEPSVAAAVRAEAGLVELADAVSSALGFTALPVAAAVHAEAGAVELADGVMASLGLEVHLPVAAAVRAEAGTVDLADPVLAAIGAGRSAIAPNVPRIPAPANNLRWFVTGVLSIAAAVLATVTAAQLTGGPGTPAAMLFAHAGDVVIEDLSYGENVQVLQIEGDDGAVILWVDEEV